MKNSILEVKNIHKAFPGVVALNDVSIQFDSGTVHALLGENGAGKSTLIKIISGVHQPTNGSVILEGNKLSHLNVKKSMKLGITAIQQELNLIPELTIAENVFLGNEKVSFLGILNRRRMIQLTQELLDRFHIDLKPTTKVRDLSISQKQIIEIIKALEIDSKVLILDEPTDVLTDKETEILFHIIRELKSQGKAIIYISHRLEELSQICDVFSVLRDGNFSGDGSISKCSKNDLIKLMIGRDLQEQFPYEPANPGETVLQMDQCKRKGFGSDVSLKARAGEVLGLYGLVGSGRSELMKCVVGLEQFEHGEMWVAGKKYRAKSVADAHKAGMYYSTEDRKKEGIVSGAPIDFNMTLPSIDSISQASVIHFGKEKKICNEMMKSLSIKAPSIKTHIQQLSGGNQQKALMAKALLTNPKLLILDEPTRGIDVGTKADIYKIINDLKNKGVSVIVISSELPEIMGISDRILVFKEGRITGEFSHEEANEHCITNAAFGIEQESGS